MKEVEGEQMGEKKFAAGGFAEPGVDLLNKYNIPKTSLTNPALDVRAYKNKEGRVMYITFFNDKPSIAIPAGYEFAGSAGQFIAETKKTDDKKEVVTATGTVEAGGDGVSVGGGPSVGGSTGVSGTGIGNSAIGIAIGAVTNAIANAIGLSNTPNDAISVTDATPSPVSDDGIDAATDASLGEAGAANANAAAAAAAAAADAAAANAAGGDGTDGSGNTGGGPGTGATGDTAFAKGGLVAKRTKKPAPAQKRGIASKK
jgi:hypothetical protein